MLALSEHIQRASDACEALAAWLANLTLGQIWSSVNYHPFPHAVHVLAVTVTVLYYGRQWGAKLYTYRRAREVYSFDWPAPEEASREWTGRVIENPSISSHLRDETMLPPLIGESKRSHITCYDPSTAYHLTTLPLLSADEVAQQIQRADNAQPTWAATTFAERQSVLRSIKAWILRDMDAIVDVACRDTGKIRVDAVLGEILTVLSKLDWLLSYGEKTLSPNKRPTNLMLAHKVSHVHYQPLGTILALVSWNYSFHNMLSPILAGLFAGNSVVVKCSEQVAWSSLWYMGGLKACLKACGVDSDVVQLVVCLPEVAETITRNPLVKHITFIGSEPVGKKVALAAAEIMVPTCIELGGKDPAFLLPSANLKQFASTWLRGAFQAAGQNCIGIELFLVPRNLLDDFISIMTPRIQALRPGIDLSSLISHAPIQRLQTILAQAEKAGARILVGGKPYAHPDHPNASYFQPTLITDVTMDMDVAREELFAPVMTVVPYDNVDEAVGWLKKSRSGLGGGVYGDDQAECRRVAAALECGMVSINDFGVFYLNQAMPFGGVKASGHGRFGGEEGLRSLCAVKAITEDRFFSWIRTPIPKPVDYPLMNGDKAYGFLDGLVGLIYGSGAWRVGGLVKLIKNA